MSLVFVLSAFAQDKNEAMLLTKILEKIEQKHNVKFKDTLAILNALVDAKITTSELELTKSKSGSAYQNKLDRKTREIWNKAKPKYKGALLGNMYYSSLRDIIELKIFNT